MEGGGTCRSRPPSPAGKRSCRPSGPLTGSKRGAQRTSHFLSVYYIPDTVIGSHLILTTACEILTLRLRI